MKKQITIGLRSSDVLPLITFLRSKLPETTRTDAIGAVVRLLEKLENRAEKEEHP